MPTNPYIQFLWKGSTDITNSVDWASIQADLVLTKEVSKIQFMMRVDPSKPVLALGDQIDFWQNGFHYFGGTIVEMETTIVGGILQEIQVTAMDWSFKMNTKLVKKTYAMMDPHDIIVDIVNTFTDGSYTTTGVQMGNFLIPSIKFNYQSVTDCIKKVANLIGWDWNVDADKNVQFFLTENVEAPFAIDDTSGNQEWSSLDIDQDLTNMKNSVIVIGGLYTKAFTAGNTPDKFNTDGIRNAYGLIYTYENDSAFTVKVNGVAQTIGVENQISDPTTVDILWNPSQRYIIFTAGAPSSGESVICYGNAKIPILGQARDSNAIAAYGEIQDAVTDKQITTIPEAQARAKAEIAMYGHAIYTIKFNTQKPGLQVGQTITVNSVRLGISNLQLTIKRLTGTGHSDVDMTWAAECYGSDQVTFVDMMSKVLQQETTDNPVSDDTIVEAMEFIIEQLNISDIALANSTVPPYQWGPGGTPPIIWGLFTW